MLFTSPFISAEECLLKLSSPNLIIIDCRFTLADPHWGYQQYLNAHIPGAHYLNLDFDLSNPVAKHGGRHPLPNPELLAAKLGSLGINQDTFVIAYDDSRFAFAARLWWQLRYLGHHQVALLDGGFNAWKQNAYPTTGAIPTSSPTTFSYTLQPQMLVDIDTVKAMSNRADVILIDSRESDRYNGVCEPIDPIAGHIPGAKNAPWTQVTNDQGYLKPQQTLQQLWQPHQQAKNIIVYCGSGVTACVNLFSLEIAGFSQTKLYPGGWSDWCSYLLK